ncbi:MAG: extracellular solute-binding protein [Candidatus Kapabacteria bacterium]|nr:extracellular solute-binding protein [Candidatus Kapabacteria bacterium]
MRHLGALCLLLCLAACAPQDKPAHTTIRFWHFWSEPAQRSTLEAQIAAFEKLHPEIDVELTELQWGDGKAKLMAAWNAGMAPDVVHLGLDWFADFDASSVFADLPDSLASDGRACRWLVNARALVVNTAAHAQGMGLCATDAHNVVKRMLPLIWQHGAPTFLTSLPVSAGMDSALVNALWSIRERVVPTGIIDRSRQLDERLLRGDIGAVFSGAWLVDMAKARGIGTLRVTPTRSILNADVLVISRNAKVHAQACALIDFLRSYDQARAFCATVSDAGMPADLDRASKDTLFTSDPLKAGFLATAMQSQPLPAGPVMLRLEPIIEDMIVRSYDVPTRTDMAQLVEQTRARLQEIEARR